MILFNSSRFNIGRCKNNSLLLWYITTNSRYFPLFNFLYVTPITLCCTNSKKLWCDSTFNNTKKLGARKWIFFMPQITVAISDVFSFPYKFIRIKWTNFVIKLSVLGPKYVLSWSSLLLWSCRTGGVLGFATQLVALQRGTRPISDILGQRTQQWWRLQHKASPWNLPGDQAINGLFWMCVLPQHCQHIMLIYSLKICQYTSKGVLIPYFWGPTKGPRFGFWAPPSTSQDYIYDESRMTDRRLSDVL